MRFDHPAFAKNAKDMAPVDFWQIEPQVPANGTRTSAEQLAQLESAAAIGAGIASMRERLRQPDRKLTIHSSLNAPR
jgi:hypothetical protein